MHIRGINQESLAAQAQYAEWRKRMQDTEQTRAAVRPDEAEEDQEARRHGEDAEEEADDQEDPTGEGEASAPAVEDDEDDGQPHLRSFA